jgi:hypothetical protein
MCTPIAQVPVPRSHHHQVHAMFSRQGKQSTLVAGVQLLHSCCQVLR